MSSEFKQTCNYKLQNHLLADMLKKKKPQVKQHLKKKRETQDILLYHKVVLVTAQNKKHLDQKKH